MPVLAGRLGTSAREPPLRLLFSHLLLQSQRPNSPPHLLGWLSCRPRHAVAWGGASEARHNMRQAKRAKAGEAGRDSSCLAQSGPPSIHALPEEVLESLLFMANQQGHSTR